MTVKKMKAYIVKRSDYANRRQKELAALIERNVSELDFTSVFHAIRELPEDKARNLFESYCDMQGYYDIENFCDTLSKF